MLIGVIALCMLVSIFIALVLDFNSTFAALFVMGTAFGVPLLITQIQYKNDEYFYYDKDKFTLYLKKRGKDASKRLKILNDYDLETSYKPKKYTYTSVRTGSVTVGGVTETGGYTYVSGKHDNGRCVLGFRGYLAENRSTRSNQVMKIVLGKEFVELAKISCVNKYLSGNTLNLVYIDPMNAQTGFNGFFDNGPLSVEGIQAFQRDALVHRSYEEYMEVINWISKVSQ